MEDTDPSAEELFQAVQQILKRQPLQSTAQLRDTLRSEFGWEFDENGMGGMEGLRKVVEKHMADGATGVS